MRSPLPAFLDLIPDDLGRSAPCNQLLTAWPRSSRRVAERSRPVAPPQLARTRSSFEVVRFRVRRPRFRLIDRRLCRIDGYRKSKSDATAFSLGAGFALSSVEGRRPAK